MTPNAGSTPAYSWFSPRAGGLHALLTLIGAAEHTLHIAAYTFTSIRLARGLTNAALRGVRVSIILDTVQATHSPRAVNILRAYPVTILLDSQHHHMHCKFIVADQRRIALGSYNYTDNADAANAENLTILTHPSMARDYLTAWQAHAAHSKPAPTLAQSST